MTTSGPARSADGTVTDALAVCLLAAIALAPLASSFHGPGWWIVGAVAVTGAVAVVLGLGRSHWGAFLVPLGLIVLYVVIGLPLASGRSGPDALALQADSLAQLARETGGCWDRLIGTLPRVDASGPVLLVPLLLGLVAAGTASALARFTATSVLPVLPLLCLLQGVFLLGRDGTDQWPYGLGFGVVALGWAGVRARRRQDAVGARSRSRLVGGAVLLGVGALLASQVAVHLPLDSDPVVLRDSLSEGYDTTGVPTLLTGFRRYTKQPPGATDNVHDERLLVLEGALAGTRLRFSVLDWYDGNQWRPDPDSRFLRIGSTIDNPAPGPEIGVRVRVAAGWRSEWVPTAGAVQLMSFDVPPGKDDPRDELLYNPLTGSALLPARLPAGTRYYFAARVPDDRIDPDQVAAQDVDPEVYAQADFLEPVAAGFLRSAGTPVRALLEAAKVFRRKGAFSNGAFGWQRRIAEGHGLERLDQQFIRAPQMVGNNEQYAAIVALLAARLRIPARVVVGAPVPRSGVVRGKDVEAWVEVRLIDGTWVTLEPRRFVGTKEPKRVPDKDRRDPVLNVQPPREQQPQQPEQQPQQPQQPQEKPSAEDDGSSPARALWPLLLLLPGLVPLAKVARRRWRRARGTPTRRAAAGWRDLLDSAADLGRAFPASRPRPTQARALGVPVAVALTADDLTFGREAPVADAVEAWWDDVASARRDLARTTPRWRRVVGWFDPRTLRPG